MADYPENFYQDVFEGKDSWTGSLFFPRVIPLHSMLSNCGYETRFREKYDFDGLQRGNSEFAIFQYTVAGEGNLQYEGKSYKMHRGDAMLLHVPHAHRYYLRKGACWRHFYLSLSGSETVQLIRLAEARSGPVVHFPEDSSPIQFALKILWLAKNKKITDSFEASSLIYEFSMKLHGFLSSGSMDNISAEVKLVRDVHQYCLRNLSEDVSVSRMAQTLGYSRAHFSRIFRESSGMSPAKYLMDLRMRAALRILQMESCSVKETGFRCGFTDESYFCRVFRKYYGRTPDQFRRQKE